MSEDLLTNPPRQAMTVTELNTLVHDVLEGCDIFSHIAVRGEISNFVHHRSGQVGRFSPYGRFLAVTL